MKNYIIKLFLLYLVISLGKVYCQKIPDYNERNIFSRIDSSLASPIGNYFSEATEGITDPDEYMVGAGDILLISISGVAELNLTQAIDKEGNFYIPNVGGVNLQNLSLSEAKLKIIAAIEKYYKNVEIFISLAGFRKLKVTLIGDVVKPLTQIVPSNSRLSDIILNSRGLNPTADLRNIIIRSNDLSEKKCDFLSFLRFGDKTYNPYLREGDAVIINKVDRVIQISGEVAYPAVYEFVEGQTADQLLKLAGGLLSEARKDTIELIRFTDDGKSQESIYYSLNEIVNGNIQLKNKDHLVVRKIPEYLIDKYVQIVGYVRYPGWYKIIEDQTTLTDIIQEAGGFLKDASLTEAKLVRVEDKAPPDPEYERLKLMLVADMTEDEYDYFKSKSRQRGGDVVIDFEKLFLMKDKSEDIFLKRNDEITIPISKNYVILLGQVVNPGNVVYNPNFSVQDYINAAGGFAWRALENGVRVVKVKTGEWIDAEDVEQLDPGDTIWIPEDPPGPKFWDVFTTSLQVLGQIAAVIAATVAVIIATR